MSRFIIIIFLLMPVGVIISNPIPVYISNGSDIDYLRGTIGEIISCEDYNIAEYGNLRITNELRYIWYNNSIPLPSDEPLSNPPYYFGKATGRLTYLFNADMGFKRFDIGFRIPYIMYFAENLADSVKTHKVSDLLVRLRYEPFTDINSMYRFNIGLGVKFSTGDNKSALPSSPGSRDYCLWTNFSIKQNNCNINFHFGYAYTGRFTHEVYVYNPPPIPWEYEELEFDAGDVINFNLALNFNINKFVDIQTNIEIIKGFDTKSTGSRNYVLNSGFVKASLSPAVTVKLPDLNSNLEFGFDLPVAHDYYYSGTEIFFRYIYSPKLF
ncbi:MAG: hypothetical protein ACP5FK_02560 [bacterium]